MKEDKIEFEESSGNIFEGLGFRNPELEQLKPALSFEIFTILKKRKLTQAQSAKVLGIDQPQGSRLKNADFSRFSVERLFSFLNRLGRDVDIHINRAHIISRQDVIFHRKDGTIQKWKKPKNTSSGLTE